MNIPFTALHFSTYESSKKLLALEEDESLVVQLTAGGLAGGVSAALTTPLDVVKTRLQLEGVNSATRYGTNAVVRAKPDTLTYAALKPSLIRRDLYACWIRCHNCHVNYLLRVFICCTLQGRARCVSTACQTHCRDVCVSAGHVTYLAQLQHSLMLHLQAVHVCLLCSCQLYDRYLKKRAHEHCGQACGHGVCFISPLLPYAGVRTRLSSRSWAHRD